MLVLAIATVGDTPPTVSLSTGHHVDAPGSPGVAASHPADRKPTATDQTQRSDRLDAVLRARRVVPAPLPGHLRYVVDRYQQRLDRPLVHRVQAASDGRPDTRRAHTEAPVWSTKRPSERSRSSLRRADDAVAAPGRARTTTSVPAGSRPSLSRMRCRSRRRTALRTTALPTERPTLKPTRAGRASCPPECATLTTSRGPPDRRPLRITARKSAPRRSRFAAGTMSAPGCRNDAVRRTRGRGPCGAGCSRWRGRRECASAVGNRAYANGGGCWAGKCASRPDSRRLNKRAFVIEADAGPARAIASANSANGLRRTNKRYASAHRMVKPAPLAPDGRQLFITTSRSDDPVATRRTRWNEHPLHRLKPGPGVVSVSTLAHSLLRAGGVRFSQVTEGCPVTLGTCVTPPHAVDDYVDRVRRGCSPSRRAGDIWSPR